MSKIFFWEKFATPSEDEVKDRIRFHEVDEDESIRDVIRGLEEKILGTKRDLSELKLSNPSVKKWVKDLLSSFPEKKEDTADYLINEFRAILNTRSREEKFIVGILQLNDTIIIAHCKKDPSLAETKDKNYSVVQTVLFPKNIIRADILKNDNGHITLSAFEYTRKWSKGHADFWGIEPEDIGWESLGTIRLTVELEKFSHPLQIPLELEDINNMIKELNISSSGEIRIGEGVGKITKVNVYSQVMEYDKFYDFYITQKEHLNKYRQFFKSLTSSLAFTETTPNDNFSYEESENQVYEISTDGLKTKITKEHPRFTICFFTKIYPGIRIKEDFLWKLYQGIFENKYMAIWHAGEDSTDEPFKAGSLNIFNKIKIPDDIICVANNLLNQLQDAESKKTRKILEYAYCTLIENNLSNKHLKHLFSSLKENLILHNIEFEFKSSDGINDKEHLIQFKSASDYNPKPNKFAEEISTTIKKYLNNHNLPYCIIYGIEDNTRVAPLYHIKSDMIFDIETNTNNHLADTMFKTIIQPIKYNEGSLIAVFIIKHIITPKDDQQKIITHDLLSNTRNPVPSAAKE